MRYIFLLIPILLNAQEFSVRFQGLDDSHQNSRIDRIEIFIEPDTPLDVSTDFTIEFWMKCEDDSNTQAGSDWFESNIIIDRDMIGNGDFGDYGIGLFEAGIVFGTQINGGSINSMVGSTDVQDNQWHHIAVTRVSSSGAVALFVDGTSDATGTHDTGDISYNDGRDPGGNPADSLFTIGKEKHDLGFGFNGWIDEVRVSDNVRYTSNFTVETSPFSVDGNTVALYHFNEGSGIVAEDATANNQDGTLNVGGTPEGPVWSSETPFSQLAIRGTIQGTIQ